MEPNQIVLKAQSTQCTDVTRLLFFFHSLEIGLKAILDTNIQNIILHMYRHSRVLWTEQAKGQDL